MVKREIELAQWVYDTFGKYRNVALPNNAMKHSKISIVEHFENKFGVSCRVRECGFKEYDAWHNVISTKPYWVLELK